MEHHNSWWPHRPRFEAGRRAELANGNVLLVTEKDYEQTDCSVHWFDYHQSGIVAGAYYNGGVRLIRPGPARPQELRLCVRRRERDLGLLLSAASDRLQPS
jgi:hypothetical protein